VRLLIILKDSTRRPKEISLFVGSVFRTPADAKNYYLIARDT
jgi:hypothetical protein